MGFLTALLLTYLPEDEAFQVLRLVMCVRPAPIRGLYLPGTSLPSLPPSLVQRLVMCVCETCSHPWLVSIYQVRKEGGREGGRERGVCFSSPASPKTKLSTLYVW